MSDQTSSSSTGVQPAAAPVEAAKPHAYSEQEVRALRQQGLDSEREDKWEEAAEHYSRALEVWYVRNQSLGARSRGEMRRILLLAVAGLFLGILAPFSVKSPCLEL